MPDRRTGGNWRRWPTIPGTVKTPVPTDTPWRGIGEGRAVGYAQYRTRGAWEGIGIGVTVSLEEMIALTPQAHSGLWDFLVNQDLIEQFRAWNISGETSLHQVFSNFRESQKLNDGLWVRILDVEAALSARRYSADGSLALEVFDPIDKRASRYRLEVSEGRGVCRATSETPDLTLDLEDLSAGSLGRPRFRHLRALGRIAGAPQACVLADSRCSPGTRSPGARKSSRRPG